MSLTPRVDSYRCGHECQLKIHGLHLILEGGYMDVKLKKTKVDVSILGGLMMSFLAKRIGLFGIYRTESKLLKKKGLEQEYGGGNWLLL
ncbi:hypothetical protein A4A49_17932 [Nicotiana attenuata]|uniref:Uncharacterized protein n=1 Tax=Nicotiana attenuata TaxID=49451 RepID=A0A314L9F2_NICAT|nr:hypothetical protein A4A49_17932 [Nicotiana attenuata]